MEESMVQREVGKSNIIFHSCLDWSLGDPRIVHRIVAGEGDYQPLYDAGRNAYIGKVFWDEDGMPNFSVPGASLAMRKEDLTLPDHW